MVVGVMVTMMACFGDRSGGGDDDDDDDGSSDGVDNHSSPLVGGLAATILYRCAHRPRRGLHYYGYTITAATLLRLHYYGYTITAALLILHCYGFTITPQRLAFRSFLDKDLKESRDVHQPDMRNCPHKT